MTDDYQVQNIYQYSRKTFKKNRKQDEYENQNNLYDADSPRSEPRSETHTVDVTPGCSCDPETDVDIASILHKKCPVISLAQQQLLKLLDGTDRLLCDNTRCCRSLYDFMCLCKELLTTQNKTQLALLVLVVVAFISGFTLGAASCGTSRGHFNSPILGCIDRFFISDSGNQEDKYCGIL